MLAAPIGPAGGVNRMDTGRPVFSLGPCSPERGTDRDLVVLVRKGLLIIPH